MARIENWNPPQLSFHTARYEWDVDYAALVHEGGQLIGRPKYPARPWTDDAIGRINVEEEFRQAWIEHKDLDASFKDFAEIVFNEFHVSMAEEKWSWPHETDRVNGETAGEIRDIIDTQALYDSQSLEFE